MMRPRISRIALGVVLGGSVVGAADVLSMNSVDEIKASAKIKVWDLMQYYKGNQSGQVPGILPGPPPAGDYYWWEGGALWGTLIDYWHLTGDDSYNDVVTQSMLFQTGPNNDYMPPNYTASLGNDDQGFWGMSAMLAAEVNFPNPPADKPQWLALAQAVFTTQAAPERHDDTCNGGMRWQIPLANNGYDYKNSIANGCFFNLGARLARYTQNTTYADWAIDTWNWVQGVGFIDPDYNIFDGAHVETNCTDINRAQFSYNNAVWLLGAANMYNFTNGTDREMWKARVDGLLQNTLSVFFADQIAYEVACETGMTCSTDMYSFKGYLHRWLATVTQLAPFTRDAILPVLRTSTAAAIKTCTAGANGRQCGFRWSEGSFGPRDVMGAGQEMNVVAALSALLIDGAAAPVTNVTGGTSPGDYNAGSNGNSLMRQFKPLTRADRAGAGILTILFAGAAVAAFVWMSMGE